ncbi:gamma-crystallin D-like [Amphiura filiformis]|uniref:gamma-crystallin D-like n=1 Tax=Amphiura filiformis TaxID=82378 RepID=UPI003B21A9B2
MACGDEKIIVYTEKNFSGACAEYRQDQPQLGDFDNKISSIKVFGSVWIGYTWPEYKGYGLLLEEGEYPDWQSFHDIHDDYLSSFKKMDMAPLCEPSNIQLFASENFSGQSTILQSSVSDLPCYGFNTTSSIKVKSGAWVLFQKPNFAGRQYILTTGSFPTKKSWGADVNAGYYVDGDDKISSLRPVKRPGNDPDDDIKVTLYEGVKFSGRKHVFTSKDDNTSDIQGRIKSAVVNGRKNWKLYSVAYPKTGATAVTELNYSNPRYPNPTSMPGADNTDGVQVLSLYPVKPDE